MNRKTKSTRMARVPRAAAIRHHGTTLSPQAKQTAAIAGAATVGAGALATAAIMFRKPLGRLVSDAAAEAGSLGENLALSNLLALAGLQKRRSSMWTIGPALGALVAGAAAGSLALIWFARQETTTNGVSTGSDRTAFGSESTSTLGAPNSISEPFDTATGLEVR